MDKYIIEKIVVNEDKIDEFIQIITPLIEETRKEKGCLKYDFHQSVKSSNVFYAYEWYKDDEAIKNHNNSTHLKKFLTSSKEFVKEFQVETLKKL